jgi:hypothetical protein
MAVNFNFPVSNDFLDFWQQDRDEFWLIAVKLITEKGINVSNIENGISIAFNGGGIIGNFNGNIIINEYKGLIFSGNSRYGKIVGGSISFERNPGIFHTDEEPKELHWPLIGKSIIKTVQDFIVNFIDEWTHKYRKGKLT